jgi:hypothetical protein
MLNFSSHVSHPRVPVGKLLQGQDAGNDTDVARVVDPIKPTIAAPIEVVDSFVCCSLA